MTAENTTPKPESAAPHVNGGNGSKLNAVKHGIFCQEVVSHQMETMEEFTALRQEFIDDYQPEGPAELLLVDKIVTAQWRLRRVWRAEAGAIDAGEVARKFNQDPQYRPDDWLLWLRLGGEPTYAMRRSDVGTYVLVGIMKELRESIEANGGLTAAAMERLQTKWFRGVSNILVNTVKQIWQQWQNTPKPEGMEDRDWEREGGRQICEWLDEKIAADEKLFQKHLQEIEQRNKARKLMGSLPDAVTLDKLGRYETRLDRQCEKAMKQLEGLQERRREKEEKRERREHSTSNMQPSTSKGGKGKMQNIEHRTSNAEHRTPNIERRTSNAEHRMGEDVEHSTLRGVIMSAEDATAHGNCGGRPTVPPLLGGEGRGEVDVSSDICTAGNGDSDAAGVEETDILQNEMRERGNGKPEAVQERSNGVTDHVSRFTGPVLLVLIALLAFSVSAWNGDSGVERRSAVAQTSKSAVSQNSILQSVEEPGVLVCNRRGVESSEAVGWITSCRLETGDTADWKSALRLARSGSGTFNNQHSTFNIQAVESRFQRGGRGENGSFAKRKRNETEA